MALDFNVEWQGNHEKTAEEIIYSIIGKPLKAGMPVTIAIIGHSRSGKSVFGLKIQDIIYARKNIDFAELVQDCVLIKPEHYAQKTKKILEGKEDFKRIQSIQMDEAKFLIDSGDWQTLKNKAIRTIAATSASIKPMLFIVIAQMLSDIDPKTRRSLDFLFTVKRPAKGKPKIICTTFWEKVTDIDKVRIVPRIIKGNIYFPEKNKSVCVYPKFRPSMPRDEVFQKYASFEQGDKRDEIFALLEQIQLKSDELTGKSVLKLKQFADYLVQNPNELSKIGDFTKTTKRWKFDKTAKENYNYTPKEFEKIEKFIQEKLLENKQKEMSLYG